MKKNSIKKHLTKYSILQKRRTTINHAFASALAPIDAYDEHRAGEALKLLGQDPNAELDCVYCGNKAHSWDHLVGLVKKGALHGFGHQVGNLVQCCRDCNSEKGSLDWEQFLETKIPNNEPRAKLRETLTAYTEQFAKPIDLEKVRSQLPAEWNKYEELKRKILEMMKEADVVADQLREKIAV